MLLVTVYMSVWFMCFGALRLQSRQQQNACNKKNKKNIHKMAKMKSEPDMKLESSDDANTNIFDGEIKCVCALHSGSQHRKCCCVLFELVFF